MSDSTQQPQTNEPTPQKKQPQKQKQNNAKAANNNNNRGQKQPQTKAEPKAILVSLKEQDRFFEETFKALESVHIDDEDDDDWGNDDDELNPEAVEKRRMEALGSAALQNITALLDEEKITEEIKKIVASSKKASEKSKEIISLKENEAIGEKVITSILFEILFEKGFLTQIVSAAPLLKDICNSNESQRCILHQIQKLVLNDRKQYVPKLNDIFFGFYDNGILSEEILFEWVDVPDTSDISKEDLDMMYQKTQGFFNWLANGDDDEDEE